MATPHPGSWELLLTQTNWQLDTISTAIHAAPVNASIAPPGFYMLFVLRPKSASLSGETYIPSVAKIVKLSYQE